VGGGWGDEFEPFPDEHAVALGLEEPALREAEAEGAGGEGLVAGVAAPCVVGVVDGAAGGAEGGAVGREAAAVGEELADDVLLVLGEPVPARDISSV